LIGLGRLLILLGIGLGLWMVWRWLMRTPPEQMNRRLIQLAIAAGLVIVLILAATGRLHPIFAAIGALLGGLFTLFARLLRTPWALPLLQKLFFFYRQNKNTAGQTAGQSSRVETRFLRMFLDHESGEMGGEVIAGRFAGYRINELELAQLATLWQDYSRQDSESAALLEAYLDRIHGETWREQCAAGAGDSSYSPPANGQMTPEEACKILGIEPGVTKEEVIAAHRRLAQRLHPDRGGSTYLAAKINRAKEVLLENTD
jgi:DnaJ-domain-containing protein 1